MGHSSINVSLTYLRGLTRTQRRGYAYIEIKIFIKLVKISLKDYMVVK